MGKYYKKNAGETMSNSQSRGVKEPFYEPSKASAWISDHWAELQKDYWVAAEPSGKVAEDPTFDGLLQSLKSKHLDPNDVAIAFIERD